MVTDEIYQCLFCDKPGREYFLTKPNPKWDNKLMFKVAIDAQTIPMCDGHAETFMRFRSMYPHMEK